MPSAPQDRELVPPPLNQWNRRPNRTPTPLLGPPSPGLAAAADGSDAVDGPAPESAVSLVTALSSAGADAGAPSTLAARSGASSSSSSMSSPSSSSSPTSSRVGWSAEPIADDAPPPPGPSPGLGNETMELPGAVMRSGSYWKKSLARYASPTQLGLAAAAAAAAAAGDPDGGAGGDVGAAMAEPWRPGASPLSSSPS